MKASEFLETLQRIKEENPAIFDSLKIEFADDDESYLKFDSITINKLYNKLKIYFINY
jgi:hypothetical protein